MSLSLMILPVLTKQLCMQAGAKEVLQAIMDTGVENVTTDRAKFALTWLTVGADQDDFKAPKGEKTFEGKSHQIMLSRLYTRSCMTCMSATPTQVRFNGWAERKKREKKSTPLGVFGRPRILDRGLADQHYQIMNQKMCMAACMSDAECSHLYGLLQSCCGTVISWLRLQSPPWL